MTRQTADDEVLRVLRQAATVIDEERCPISEAIAAVAALQAERDALRADRDEQQRLYVKRIEAKHAAWEEAVSWRDMLAEQVQVAEGRAERAESALEALRGQVAGLLNTCVDVIEEGLCASQSYDYRARAQGCAEQIKALLAIKERMG